MKVRILTSAYEDLAAGRDFYEKQVGLQVSGEAEHAPNCEIPDDNERRQPPPVGARRGQTPENAQQRQCRRQHHRGAARHP